MNESQPPSRRTIVQGAVWSVPVIATAVAAPAASASSNCDTHKGAGLNYDWPSMTFTINEDGTYTRSLKLNYEGTTQDGSPLTATVTGIGWPVLGPDDQPVATPFDIQSGDQSEVMHYTRPWPVTDDGGNLPTFTYAVDNCEPQTIRPPSDT